MLQRRKLGAKPANTKGDPAVTVQAMGYFWIGTSKLDDWTRFATGQLGLQAVDRGGAMRAFRMDDRKQRLIADGGLPDGERFFGWEVADAAALDALAARMEKGDVAVRQESAAARAGGLRARLAISNRVIRSPASTAAARVRRAALSLHRR